MFRRDFTTHIISTFHDCTKSSSGITQDIPLIRTLLSSGLGILITAAASALLCSSCVMLLDYRLGQLGKRGFDYEMYSNYHH